MSRVVERVIDVEGRESNVSVRTERSVVKVRWLCGDTRTFSYEELRTAIRCLELLEPYDDVWMQGQDSAGRAYLAHITDGEFYADTAISNDASHVPWKEMRKTLRRAMP